MKSIILTTSLCLFYTFANAQDIKEADVPAKVKDAFMKKYPGTKAEEWEKKGVDYLAEFEINKMESVILFTADGIFKELVQEIKVSELPREVTDYCSKNYGGFKLEEATKITNNEEKIQFEVEIEKAKEEFDLTLDDNGNFIKKSAHTDRDDDNN